MCTASAAATDSSEGTRPEPGLVALFGSGETSASGHAVFDLILRRVSPPIRVAILETPAGFQPNSAAVAGELADFLRHRLRNYQPEVIVVPARARGSRMSPDDVTTVAHLLQCNVVLLGPGSPTYAARQLRDSLAWHTVTGLNRLGASVVLSSAAAIAAGAYVLPVYEIFKAGEDLHWQAGLDFFGPYGLPMVLVPHWNNTEGGADLDTSRCFMGQARFERLLALLPAPVPIVGIDEHTALILDLSAGLCRISGHGGVTVMKSGEERRFTGTDFMPIGVLGDFRQPPPEVRLPADTWQIVLAAWRDRPQAASAPASVLALVEVRAAARARDDWSHADALREQMAVLGWHVKDTPEGPRLVALSDRKSQEERP
jgi:hypothetical protein